MSHIESFEDWIRYSALTGRRRCGEEIEELTRSHCLYTMFVYIMRKRGNQEMSRSARDKKVPQPLVRIDSSDKAVLDHLSAKTGESTPKLLHRAVMQLKKEIFFEQMNEAYKHLRADKDAWASETEERMVFENASGDGLKDQ